MRALAETENIRKRIPKQIEDAKLFGIQGFANDLLPVADILESANKSLTEDVVKDTSKSLLEGLKLAEAELHKVFNKNGLSRMGAMGDEFDPNLHESLCEVPGDKPGTIGMVSRCGYTLHGRTLRAARVGIVPQKN